MRGAQPRAVIFDCDGVLVDSEWLASRVEAELLRELGLNISAAEAHDLFLGKTVQGVLDVIAARTGTQPSAAFTYNWAFATAHAFRRELQAVPGCEQPRSHCASAAIRSRSPRNRRSARVRFSLEVAGLADFFGEHVYVTSMVPRPKPAPDIYLLAAARLAVDPARLRGGRGLAGRRRGRAGLRHAGHRLCAGVDTPAMRASGATVMRSMDELPALIPATG